MGIARRHQGQDSPAFYAVKWLLCTIRSIIAGAGRSRPADGKLVPGRAAQAARHPAGLPAARRRRDHPPWNSGARRSRPATPTSSSPCTPPAGQPAQPGRAWLPSPTGDAWRRRP